MKKLTLLCCLTGIVTAFGGCTLFGGKDEDSEPTPIIEKAIPNGLIPGSVLILKGRNFDGATKVSFANTNVESSQFLRTSTGEITVRVPLGTQAGNVQITNQSGMGKARNMTLLTTNSNLTTDNVTTQTGDISMGVFYDGCSPRYMIYCMRGKCIYLSRSVTSPTCFYQSFTTEQIGGYTFEVFRHTEGLFKYQKINSNYTGVVILELTTGGTYVGSIRKDKKIVTYSVATGEELTLCAPNLQQSFLNNTLPSQYCNVGVCNNCQ